DGAHARHLPRRVAVVPGGRLVERGRDRPGSPAAADRQRDAPGGTGACAGGPELPTVAELPAVAVRTVYAAGMRTRARRSRPLRLERYPPLPERPSAARRTSARSFA